MPFHKNIILYWHDECPPESVLDVAGQWQVTATDWRVTLYSRETAAHFLASQYGQKVSDLFCACRIPAMQADLFRVFAILAQGGLYSDITFAPTRAPEFISPAHDVTAVKGRHGKFINGLFYARQGSPDLDRVGREIIRGVAERADNRIWAVSGPGAWFRAATPHDNPRFNLLSLPDLLGQDLTESNYRSSTRGTRSHWSERQKTESLYTATPQ